MSILFANDYRKKFIPLDLVFYSNRYNLPHFLSSIPSEIIDPDKLSNSIISFLLNETTTPYLYYDIYIPTYEKRTTIFFCVPSNDSSKLKLTNYTQNDLDYINNIPNTVPDKFFLKLHKVYNDFLRIRDYKTFIKNIQTLLLQNQNNNQISNYDNWVTTIFLSHIEFILETYREFVS